MLIKLILLVFLALLSAVVCVYNNLVRKHNLAKEGWSGVDVQLKRRADLIPNLVESVKGYASHESSVFERVAQMRSGVSNAAGPEERAKAEGMLATSLGQLFAIAENYPVLKADKNFQDLQKEMADIEDQVQYARRYYNAAVRDFNTDVELFPSNIVATAFKFPQMKYFQLESDADKAVPHVALG